MSADPEVARFLAALRGIVGPPNVLVAPEDVASYLTEPRDIFHGQATAVVRPASTEETAQVVKLCQLARRPIVPQGGNTGLVGGQTPDATGRAIVLSLARLKRVREVDTKSDTMIVDAGVTLAEAQAAAEAHDRLFPLSLASEGTCTIGGNLSTNAGGVAVLSYGNARELTRGVEVVLPNGSILNGLTKLRKDNTGYDLKDLFVGAEGTLGVITAASLRLFPRPRAIATALAGVAGPRQAMLLFASARARFAGELTSFELLPRIAIDYVLRRQSRMRDPLVAPHAWYALIEVSAISTADAATALEEQLSEAHSAGVVEDACVAASLEQRAALWRIRETLPEAQKPEGASMKHDVSVAVSDIPDFIEEATTQVERVSPGARVVAFGHVGDGNIHFNVSQPVGANPEAFLDQTPAVNAAVHGIVTRLGGSVAAEHGVGRLKRELLASVKDPAALSVMKAIKAALDPHNLMNPGKVL